MVSGVSGTMAGNDGGGGFLTKDSYGNGAPLYANYGSPNFLDGLVSICCNCFILSNVFCKISIRAPVRGATRVGALQNIKILGFQSTHLCGVATRGRAV